MTPKRRHIDEECRNLAPRLKGIRGHLGLTQAGLSAAFAKIGVRCSRDAIAKIEAGANGLTLPVAVAYATLAGISVEQLISPQPVRLEVAI